MSKKRKAPHVHLSATESDVTCDVCRNVLRDPHTCDCRCGRSFCHACLSKWIAVDRRCPHCNVALPTDRLNPAGRQFWDILDRIPRSCANSTDCKYRKCARTEMELHAAQDCQYRLVECPNEECDQRVEKRTLSDHLRVCRLQRCCNFRRKITDGESRKVYGCPEMGTRAEMKAHEPRCHFTGQVLGQIDELCRFIDEGRDDAGT